MAESVEEKRLIGDPAAIAKKIHVPTYDEVLERIKSRYPRGGRRLLDREMARLQATHDILISKTSFIRDLVRLLDGLHPFYWRLIEIDFDRRRIREAIKCVARARKLAGRFFEKYRFLLLASEGRREILRTSSEGRGRILSGLKKCKRDLDYLRNLVVFLQHLPAIDALLPTIIVAGAPSTGKSTLVKNVTRAQTKVASYPFTTTRIHIGHVTYELPDGSKLKVQVIDTPGLLDRPPEEMNQVERRAVAALEELRGVILFLEDVSPDAYMSAERQFRLLETIVENYGSGKTIIVALNKLDRADPESLAKAEALAGSLLEKGMIAGVVRLVAVDRGDAERVLDAIVEKHIARANVKRLPPS